MRAIRAISAALLGVGALTLTACTTAVASGDVGNAAFGYNLDPETVSPGGRISLPVRGCNGDATVVSGVFDRVTIPKGRASATATVDRDARPGTSYDVTFQCGHEYGHRKLAIGAARNEHSAIGGYSGNQGGGYSGNQGGGYGGNQGGGYGGNQGGGYGGNQGGGQGYEKHGVSAGLGGSIGGFNPKEIGLGAVLIVGTVGAAWRMARRRATPRS